MESMDPRLQRACLMRRQGIRKRASSSTASDETAVVAKVNDLSAWEALSEVRIGETLGDRDSDGTWVVTARIPLQRVEAVRSQSFVLSLKAAHIVRPSLVKTTEETLARVSQLPAGHKVEGGKGVVVGIVDFGCDFAHKNFISSSGKTRIKAIWDQRGNAAANSLVQYGRLYKESDINNALTQAAPYTALGYTPEVEAHGTHVMDIAAGSAGGTGVPGVAPRADIIFVEVAAADVPWDGVQSVGKSFGDSVQLLEAVKFIFGQAGTTPCVVNLSLGTNGGPHDGSTLVEEGLDRLVKQAPNRAIVIAASNSYSDGIHASAKVAQGETKELKWNVPLNDTTSNELELWYPGNDRITVELIAPDGASLGSLVPGGPPRIAKQNGRVVVFAVNRLNDSKNHQNTIGIYLEPSAPGGTWRLKLHGTAIQNGEFHAWIERDDYGQSSFPPPADNTHTLGSISCGYETIVVGSYDAHKAATPLSYFSSAGPTRDGRQKPEISAPGHAVVAALSRSGNGVVTMSGTSMAAPAVTGIVALVLSEAKARNIKLNSQQIRSIITSTARRTPPTGTAWHDRYGAGRINAAESIKKVMQLAGGSTQPGKKTTAKKSATKTAAKKAVVKKKHPPTS